VVVVVVVAVAVVVVVDIDGDGDVEVDATVDESATQLRRGATDTLDMLSFQRLDVYQRAIEFLALVYDVVDELPRGHADRADQLTRAAESVIRNIAEGAGRWSEADSANRYKIARGEAMECAASLDVMKLRRVISDAQYARGSQLLEGVVAMLTKMV
jgi:four helix bundle protein